MELATGVSLDSHLVERLSLNALGLSLELFEPAFFQQLDRFAFFDGLQQSLSRCFDFTFDLREFGHDRHRSG